VRPQAHKDRTNAKRPASIGIVATVISAAKVASNFSNWQDVVNSDLIHEHGREEVQGDLHGNPTQNADKLKRLFEEGTRLYILWPRVSADLARHCEMAAFPPPSPRLPKHSHRILRGPSSPISPTVQARRASGAKLVKDRSG